MKRNQGKSKKEQIEQENEFFSEDINTEEQTSTMISENNGDISVVSKLQQQLDQLQQEKESLEIDKVCLQQQNHELKTRIDDVATHFPKASILLGKRPDEVKQKKVFSILSKKK